MWHLVARAFSVYRGDKKQETEEFDEKIYDRAGNPEDRHAGTRATAGGSSQVQSGAAPAWAGHPVAGIVYYQQQDVLHVPGHRREAHLPARRAERLPCHQGYGDRQDHRPHDRRAIARTNSTQGLRSSAWSPQLQPEILTTLRSRHG